MGALTGVTLGVGLLLVWRSVTVPRRFAGGRALRWWARRQELIRQSGVDHLGVGQLLGAELCCAVVAAVVAASMTHALTIAACFAVFAVRVPTVLLRRLRRRRAVALRDVWPEAIDNLASAVRAGMSLPDGVSALAEGGPVALRAPFARFSAAHRLNGRFSDCLDSLKSDLADPVGDRVCETLRVARDVGGSDLGSVLRTLSELLRADARVRAELETRQGWVVNAARLAVAAPWAVLVLLGTQSSTLQAYDSRGGAMVLLAGAGVCALAYRVMVRIGRLPEDRRVLS